MSRPPTCCHLEACLEEAAPHVWDGDRGAVIVTGADGKLAGIITDRDICMAAHTQGKSSRELRMAEAMAKQVYSCREADFVGRALWLMAESQVRRLPVVTPDDRPSGLHSLNNLVRYRADSDEHLRWQVLQTIAAISEPRSIAPWPQGACSCVQIGPSETHSRSGFHRADHGREYA